MKQKTCPHCKETKKADEFWKNTQSVDGLCSYCKICQNEIRRTKRKNKIGYWANEQKERQQLKEEVFNNYGGTKCCKCGFNDIRALSIDHINGGGNLHRRELFGKNAGGQFYNWLRNNGYPTGFQVLCMNCQFIKRHENKECSS